METTVNLKKNQVKQYIKDIVTENLSDFDAIYGGEQRTYGDLIQKKVCDILFENTNELITETKRARSKKSVEDVTLISNGIKYYVDPKSHDTESDFSMPNLTSIEKIKNIYHSKNEELLYVFVSYTLYENTVFIKEIKVLFFWEIDIEICNVGALGNGQLQIKDAGKELKSTDKGKLLWYEDFKKLVMGFFERRIIKINKQKLKWQ
jgi:hypothetical protein